MPRKAEGLSAAGVKTAAPGRYGDGAGLYLLVRSAEARFWLFRYVRGGKMREMGLGAASGRTAVSLADARKKARRLYDMVRDGRDPLAEKVAERAAAAVEAAKVISFKSCGESYIEAHRAGWRNAKHAKQWAATLETYAYPAFGTLPVQAVDTGLVLKAIEPIWKTKTETANRVRGRVESILDWATARGYRQGDNPARWKGHLDNLLPARGKVQRVTHHPALPYVEAGAFVADLRKRSSSSALALEFLMLTVTRTGETLGAKLSEIDAAERMWIVPPERMKAGKEHRVPLSPRAIEIVETMKARGAKEFLFPGAGRGKPLSNMALLELMRGMKKPDGGAWCDRDGTAVVPHGFRSTFRDWAADRTSYPKDLAEMALAHTVSDKVEAAYRRSDMFDKRRRLMEEWDRFCARPAVSADVRPIRAG